ncbi:hypothetical protein Rhe02_03250 [Rhizocola hellebori]|uniref:Tetratricopeptide repeat protein n=1 Tax=Rhizocola hellebori TaxID=1392758 RepID=A0A8J3Q2J3_9ACTN|nr:tetratricopeptide repeat protein [Rhizocola hellebori]GIH02258.1 hypothetical protein Rhe02_03250 [Rhizocola hellebori]
MDDGSDQLFQAVEIAFHRDVTIRGGVNIFGINNAALPVPTVPPADRDEAAAWLFGPASPPPANRLSTWLDPAAMVFDVVERPETDELFGWCVNGPAAAAQLVCGPGGQGKTVLALQLCQRLRDRGWLAGVVRSTEGERLLAAAAHSATLPDVQGALLVVDYADANAELAAALLDVVAGVDREVSPVRLLLLARQTGRWWSELVTRHRSGLGLVDPQVRWLASLPESLTASGQSLDQRTGLLWRAAAESFAAKAIAEGLLANELALPREPPGPFQTTLDLYADALISVLDQIEPTTATRAMDPIEHLLEAHEHRQLRLALAAAAGDIDLGPEPMRLLDVVCLLPFQHSREAARAMAALPQLADVPAATVDALVRTLAGMYPGDVSIWQAPKPDRLCDLHLLKGAMDKRSDEDWAVHITNLTRGSSAAQAGHVIATLLRALSAPTADTVHQLGARRLGHAVAALVRMSPATYLPALVAADHHERFTALMLEAIRDPATELHVVRAVDQLLADQLLPRLRQVAVQVSRRLAVPSDSPGKAYIDDLITLSRRLSEAGHHGEALTAARQATGLLVHVPCGISESGDWDPGEAATHASAWNNLGSRLTEHRQMEEAIAAFTRAAQIRRRLSDMDERLHLPALVAALVNLCACQIDAGQAQEAIGDAREVIEAITRQAATSADYTYRLALAWGNLSDALRASGRIGEAIESAATAIELMNELSTQQPLVYRLGTASARLRLAACLATHQLDQPGGSESVSLAIRLAGSAAETFRALSTLDFDGYRSHFANALQTLAICAAAGRRPVDGLAAIEEALAAHRREPAEAADGVDLAACLTVKALLLIEASRAGAVDSAREAVTLYERAAVTHPHLRRDLAAAYGNLSYALLTAHRHDDAVAAAQQAILIQHERNAEPVSPAEMVEMADGLANLALCFVDAHQFQNAYEAQASAVDLYHQAAGDYPISLKRLRNESENLQRLQTAAAAPDTSRSVGMRGRFRKHWPLAPIRHLLPGIGTGFWVTQLGPHRSRPRQLREEMFGWFERILTGGRSGGGKGPSEALSAAAMARLATPAVASTAAPPLWHKALTIRPGIPTAPVTVLQHSPALGQAARGGGVLLLAVVSAFVLIGNGPVVTYQAAPSASASTTTTATNSPQSSASPSADPIASTQAVAAAPGPSPSTTGSTCCPTTTPPAGTFPIGIDLTDLTMSSSFTLSGVANALSSRQPQAMSLAPAAYQLSVGGKTFAFSVTTAGTIQYDEDASYLDGRGTATLTVRGHRVNLDMRQLSYAYFGVPGYSSIIPTSSIKTISVFPGRHQVTGFTTTLDYTVHPDGSVTTTQSEPFLTVSGSNTVVGHGLTIHVDMRELTYSKFGVGGISSIIPKDPVATIRVFPGGHQVTTASLNIHDFTVRADGTVSSGLAFLSANGDTLVAHGYLITIDATRQSAPTFELTAIGSVLPSRTPHTFTLAPGRHRIVTANATFYFTVQTNGTVTYDPSLTYLAGSGTDTLIVS